MTSLNIFIYTYFNDYDDYFQYIYIYVSMMTAFNIFTRTYFNDVSMWTILHAPVSTMIHAEHRCRYNEDRIQLHCPGGEIQLAAVMKQSKKLSIPYILRVTLGYCAELQSSCTPSNFRWIILNIFTDEM